MVKLFQNIRFDRNELSGSFGDIGTSFPLIIGMIAACKLDACSVLVMFGLMQIFTGIVYGIPMSVQPLKAMAVIMISQKLGGDLLYGGGFAIGITMFLLTVSGMLTWITKIIPENVIRGVQFGLGLSLATLALKDYLPSEGVNGYILAFLAFTVTLLLLGNRKFPPALVVMTVTFIYAFFLKVDVSQIHQGIGLNLPHLNIPSQSNIASGFILLAMPQLALSISNSVVATQQTAKDLFPDSNLSIRKIGITYSIMNVINPFFSGMPTCHGSGGIAGHYTFGARTGGSIVIYGVLCITLGLSFSNVFTEIVKFFPLPVLGVILLFESLTLMSFIRSVTHTKHELYIALLVALACLGLPNGYVIGLVLGTILMYLKKKHIIKGIED